MGCEHGLFPCAALVQVAPQLDFLGILRLLGASSSNLVVSSHNIVVPAGLRMGLNLLHQRR